MASNNILDPPIPLVRLKDPDDYGTVELNFKFHMPTQNPGGTNEIAAYWDKRKEEVPFCPDSVDKEQFIHTLIEFTDATVSSRLNILNAPNALYKNLRLVLGGDLRIMWDRIKEQRIASNTTIVGGTPTTTAWTVAQHSTDAQTLITNTMGTRAYEIQDRYLHNSSKPFKQSCQQLYARLTLIARYMHYFPGGHPNVDNGIGVYSKLQFKSMYYNMMPQAWRDEFDKAGLDLSNDTYLPDQVMRYFSVQESIANRGRNPNPRLTQPTRRANRQKNRNYRRNQPYTHAPVSSGRPAFGPSPPPASRAGRGSYGGRGGFGGRGSRGGRGGGWSPGGTNPRGRVPLGPGRGNAGRRSPVRGTERWSSQREGHDSMYYQNDRNHGHQRYASRPNRTSEVHYLDDFAPMNHENYHLDTVYEPDEDPQDFLRAGEELPESYDMDYEMDYYEPTEPMEYDADEPYNPDEQL